MSVSDFNNIKCKKEVSNREHANYLRFTVHTELVHFALLKFTE